MILRLKTGEMAGSALCFCSRIIHRYRALGAHSIESVVGRAAEDKSMETMRSRAELFE